MYEKIIFLFIIYYLLFLVFSIPVQAQKYMITKNGVAEIRNVQSEIKNGVAEIRNVQSEIRNG